MTAGASSGIVNLPSTLREMTPPPTRNNTNPVSLATAAAILSPDMGFCIWTNDIRASYREASSCHEGRNIIITERTRKGLYHSIKPGFRAAMS